MARASYLVSARAMALGTPPLAWFYAAAWSVFTPPLTLRAFVVRPASGDSSGFPFFILHATSRFDT
jgi:hypothetical protein